MMLKVFISPSPDQIKLDNGIGQVVHAQYKYLPEYDIELVGDPSEAEIITCHIQQGDLPRVDVLHSHGLYWSGDPQSGTYHAWHHEANRRILDAARRAFVVTVPSDWVAQPFRRDMRLNPVVIGHGIDIHSLPAAADARGEYVLWNKNRADGVCSPAAAEALAKHGIKVVSTFGEPSVTMQVIGPQAHASMLDVLRHARYYLATTKETFGIGILEALALGVPIIGYAWGNTPELVPPDCGVLVAPGDVDGLIVGLSQIDANYAAYSRACRDRAEHFTWQSACEQYARVYHQAAALKRAEAMHSGVSVVITNYNYGRFVEGAIRSVLQQSYAPAELIVVDDGSTDESRSILPGPLFAAPSSITVKYLPQDNEGVAAARNNGIALAEQAFIVCLDADDELAPDYLKACHEAMIQDRALGVAYTGLSWIDSDPPVNIWHSAFSWEEQATPGVPPKTTIHCAAMFRRDMWQRSGGYQQIYAPGEDTEFWTRSLALGYQAKQVTPAPLFLYRNSPGGASKTKPYRPIDTWHPWMRDKQYPMAAPAYTQPLVRSYSDPLVTVVIPVGPGHSRLLPAALDSLLGQTFRDWAVIVVDDSKHDEYDDYLYRMLYQRYPFMTLVGNNPSNRGTGAARNLGLSFVRSPLILWLDADDYLLPDALQAMVNASAANNASFIYTDWYSRNDAGELVAHQSPEYDQSAWLDHSLNAVTALMPTADARAVGGFDTGLPGWEDWDFFIKLTISGRCGMRVPVPLLVYRHTTGTRREAALEQRPQLLDLFRSRYGGYATKEIPMAGCGSCGDGGSAIIQARQAFGGMSAPEPIDIPIDATVVRMEFIGTNFGAVTFYGQRTRQTYRGGLDPMYKYINADPQDVEHLENTGQWKAISPMPQPQPVPTPVAEIINPQTFNPGPPLLDDDMTPAQEAALNKAAAEQARKIRKAS